MVEVNYYKSEELAELVKNFTSESLQLRNNIIFRGTNIICKFKSIVNGSKWTGQNVDDDEFINNLALYWSNLYNMSVFYEELLQESIENELKILGKPKGVLLNTINDMIEVVKDNLGVQTKPPIVIDGDPESRVFDRNFNPSKLLEKDRKYQRYVINHPVLLNAIKSHQLSINTVKYAIKRILELDYKEVGKKYEALKDGQIKAKDVLNGLTDRMTSNHFPVLMYQYK